MQKIGEKTRDIKFFSKKNQALVCVHTVEERAYTKYLEETPNVSAYEVYRPLILERLQMIKKVDIRADYMTQQGTTDFYLTFDDGRHGVREVIRPKQLEKRAVIEQLELSRRYWALFDIADWKNIVMEG